MNDGDGGNNYALTFVSKTTGQITPLAITVAAASSTKIYDGTASSLATPTITGQSPHLVSTLAGSAQQVGSSDGTGSAVRLVGPGVWRWTAR